MKQRLGLTIVLAFSSSFTMAMTDACMAFTIASKEVVSQRLDRVEKVGMVCDDWGRCWRTGPSYYGGGWGPGAYYGGWRPQPSYYYGGGYNPYYGGGWGRGQGWRGHHGHHGDHDD
jgi:hypothetical protein